MPKPRPCRCPDYPFPHRRGGGKCGEQERDVQRAMQEEAAENFFMRKFGHYPKPRSQLH